MIPMAPAIDCWAPCSPVACARPRWDSVRRRTYTSAASERGAAVQAAMLSPHGPRSPLTGPLSVSLHYVLPIPSSWSRRKQEDRSGQPHVGKPDLDNLAKLTMDVLSRLRWWHDDAQVVRLQATKKWGAAPGVHVVVGYA